jgi:hypothetical protein
MVPNPLSLLSCKCKELTNNTGATNQTVEGLSGYCPNIVGRA